MKPGPFTYHDPTELADAVALIGAHENARALAGGQSLVPMMNFRYAMPDHLIDLNGVSALSFVDCGERIRLGAMTRQRDVEFSKDLEQAVPILREALLNVGHRQTRNRGTIGGSICNLDPSAEMPAIMLLHDAELTAHSTRGVRKIPMNKFALGFMTTALEPDELLTEISFARWGKGHGHGFHEYARRHGDFAICSAGVLIEADSRGEVARLAIVVGGLGATPVRLSEFEAAAKGYRLADELISEAAAAASRTDALSDAHFSADYRRHLAGVLTRRAMKSAIERIGVAAYV
jgi:carbon-monoxide dehydrogenase medium subunit